ncbi:MAG: helix-turn-helix transcriptional regulator [Clostridia bacterium]|nr:helix-turn-helix transcriptional regulator [Clostridia bacterium]
MTMETSYPLMSLAAARVNAKLTQKELADKVGVSESTIIAWESGRRYPNVRMLGKIEQALGVSLNFIRFGG